MQSEPILFPEVIRYEAMLSHSLAQAQKKLQKHQIQVARSLADLGGIDLPDSSAEQFSAQQLQLLGSLYVIAELENTGLIAAAEAIASLFASGSINAPIGEAGPRLAAFWKQRKQRMSQGERIAFYQQVFDVDTFRHFMRRWCESIRALAHHGALPDVQATVAYEYATQSLLGSMSGRTEGMVSFAAGEILQVLTDALVILKDKTLQGAFGVRNLWALVLSTQVESEQSLSQIQSYVDRGKAGQALFDALADKNLESQIIARPNASELPQWVADAHRWILADTSLPAISYEPERVNSIPWQLALSLDCSLGVWG
jgi:hypothetical protein